MEDYYYERFEISGMCMESFPCQHKVTIHSRDGKDIVACMDGVHILKMMRDHDIPQDNIPRHFLEYDNFKMPSSSAFRRVPYEKPKPEYNVVGMGCNIICISQTCMDATCGGSETCNHDVIIRQNGLVKKKKKTMTKGEINNLFKSYGVPHDKIPAHFHSNAIVCEVD